MMIFHESHTFSCNITHLHCRRATLIARSRFWVPKHPGFNNGAVFFLTSFIDRHVTIFQVMHGDLPLATIMCPQQGCRPTLHWNTVPHMPNLSANLTALITSSSHKPHPAAGPCTFIVRFVGMPCFFLKTEEAFRDPNNHAREDFATFSCRFGGVARPYRSKKQAKKCQSQVNLKL